MLSVLLVLLVATGASPDDKVPQRQGFTLEFGFGMGLTTTWNHTTTDPGASTLSPLAKQSGTRFGIAPPSLSLGAFITRDFALMARTAGTSYFTTASDGHLSSVGSTFYGITGQYWLSDAWFIGAGVGLGVYGTNPLTPSADDFHVTGVAFTGRGGYSFFNRKHISLAAVLELFPAFYHQDVSAQHEDLTALGAAVIVQLQYF